MKDVDTYRNRQNKQKGFIMMWIIHILAVLFFIPALLVTIPLHIIIANQQNQGGVK